jgi:hypothetical protein
MAAEQPPTEALRAGTFRKSSFSPERQPDCVMVTEYGDWIGLQDSKEYASTPKDQRTTLAVPRAAFAQFVQAVKNGELDGLV